MIPLTNHDSSEVAVMSLLGMQQNRQLGNATLSSFTAFNGYFSGGQYTTHHRLAASVPVFKHG